MEYVILLLMARFFKTYDFSKAIVKDLERKGRLEELKVKISEFDDFDELYKYFYDGGIK